MAAKEQKKKKIELSSIASLPHWNATRLYIQVASDSPQSPATGFILGISFFILLAALNRGAHRVNLEAILLFNTLSSPLLISGRTNAL
jgi:hypothetical protein